MSILKCCKNLDIIEYDRIKDCLSNLPMTWYPALIIHMVKIAYKKKVFKRFGASHMIKTIEENEINK